MRVKWTLLTQPLLRLENLVRNFGGPRRRWHCAKGLGCPGDRGGHRARAAKR